MKVSEHNQNAWQLQAQARPYKRSLQSFAEIPQSIKVEVVIYVSMKLRSVISCNRFCMPARHVQ